MCPCLHCTIHFIQALARGSEDEPLLSDVDTPRRGEEEESYGEEEEDDRLIINTHPPVNKRGDHPTSSVATVAIAH